MLKELSNMYKEEFKDYDLKKFGRDTLSGITVAFVALPLALALGVANGVDARAGIASSIFSGIIISLLGGGSFQINGATASTVAVLSIVSVEYGVQGVFLSGLISGIIILLVRILNFTRYFERIPDKVIDGLASGLGLMIIVGELDNFFGLGKISGSIFEIVIIFFRNINKINGLTAVIGIAGLLFLLMYPKKLNKTIPNSLILVVSFIFINRMLNLGVDIVGTIPKSLINNSRLMLGEINFQMIIDLLIPSFNLAILLLIKSLSSGFTGSKMKEEEFRVNEEVTALGVGNIILSFLGCVPSAASISATQVGIRSGGETRITSIMNSITLIFIVFVLSSIIEIIPIAVLSSIVVYTGYKMIKFDNIKNIEFLVTFISIIFVDISIAAFIGIITSLILNRKNYDLYLLEVENEDSEIKNKSIVRELHKIEKHVNMEEIIKIDN